ncbi:hypothetical protein QQP08_016225 [Theobroma cacao]|nr:hypothetical protein QQP08_016225 [Theobroma cacao]
MFVHHQERWQGMAPEVLPPPGKRPRIVAPIPDFIPSFTNISRSPNQPIPYFHYQNRGCIPSPSPHSFHPMQHQQGQGFMVNNPNPGVNLVLPPTMVKPVTVQDFQLQHQKEQGFAVKNPSGGVFSATTVKPVQVHGLNLHQAPISCLLKPYATMSVVPERSMPIENTPPGPRPVAPGSSQLSFPQLSSAVLSELLKSVGAQGLAKPNEETPVKDAVPLEFDAHWLKVRHESVIRSLYSDFPRQCQTCGQRFKTQENHSKHMDWHVRKNREIKKKKVKPSRQWLLTESQWLACAAALTDTDNGDPPVFVRRDSIVEMKTDEELAVGADEDQRVCALCMEAFEDFYSDETEDWMYKGAVYMRAPNGSMSAGKDRSQLGPIVHAKCLPQTGKILNNIG